MPQNIVFLDCLPEDQKLVKERFPEARIIDHAPEEMELIEQCADAAVISTFIYTSFTRKIIEKLPLLKLLVTRSVGYDHIDLDACAKHGITVCNVPDYGSHVIAEHVFALLLSTLRHIPEADNRVEGGTFDYHGLRGMALRGKTIGIVGTGKIGRSVARIAHGLEMKILATDQCRTLELVERFGVEYVLLSDLLQRSDIVTLHVPATKETEHMLNRETLALLRRGSTLVNTARGSLIDSAALLEALESGKIGHALLDVLEHEQNFAENIALIHHPRVVTTPHIAFYADDSMRNMYLDCFQSIEEWQHGEVPEHVVQRSTVVCDLAPIHRM